MPHSDNLSRALLALILVCLVVGILRGGGGATCAPKAAPEVAAAGSAVDRYSLRIIGLQRKPPQMLRTDTATGEAWTMGILDAGPWKPLPEGPEGVPAAGADTPGRYAIIAVKLSRGAPNLVRTDHQTGRVWRKGSMNDGPWVAVPNPGEPSLADVKPAARPAAPQAAPATPEGAGKADAEVPAGNAE
jgi:hypothetical protein